VNFRAKTIIGIAAIEIILLVILVVSAMTFLGSSNERQLLQRANATATMFSHAVTDAVLSTDLATLDDLVHEIMQIEDVVYVKIVGFDKVLASGGDQSLIAVSKKLDESLDAEDDIFDTVVDIKVNNQTYGYIELGFTTRAISSMITQARRSIIGIASLEVLLVALFSYVLGTYLTRSLVRLRDAAQTVKQKGPGYQIKIRQKDELGEVIGAFDSMSKSLADNYHELQIAREEAEHANEAKSRFIASMSHEIRTPMNGVLGLLAALDQTPLSEAQKKLVNTAAESGNLMLSLINNILDFSRMEANSLVIEREAFGLRLAATRVLNSLQPVAEQSGIKLTLDMHDIPEFVLGDQNRFTQILLNLVGNAIKFTPQGSVEITLQATTLEPNRINLIAQIRDTGIGIKEEDLPHLFDEFTMVDHSFTRNREGSGLGLAICKRLINLMDGTISVKSIEQIGSCFTFTLPLEVTTQVEFNKKNAAPSALNPRCKNCRVLVAEDNTANQLVIQNLFRPITPHIDIVGNGREAVDKVSANDYDIIFMDISMPEMDGLNACKIIRKMANPAKSSLPIIAFTAHALTGDKEKFLSAGMNDYLAKPVSLTKLIETLNNYILNNHILNNYIAGETPANPDENAPDKPRVIPATSTPIAAASTQNSPDVFLLSDELSDEQILDEQTLRQIIKDTGPDVLSMLIDHYVQETRTHQAILIQAKEKQQPDQIQFESHKMISSALALGNKALSELAQAIEIACINQDFKQAYTLVETLDELADRSLEALLAKKEQITQKEQNATKERGLSDR
jgi:signal transduction histidine kinase/CheY-like chemotaxis protein/HPt (histidine-containing phosphotransfer) domain-containing protein